MRVQQNFLSVVGRIYEDKSSMGEPRLFYRLGFYEIAV